MGDRVLNNLLIILILNSMIFAIEIKTKRDLMVDFIKDKEIKTFNKFATYYRYGIKDDANKFTTTGYLIVRLEKNSDLSKFEKYKLVFVKNISKELNSYKVQNLSTLDDVELCAELMNEKRVIWAKPMFKSKKRLQ